MQTRNIVRIVLALSAILLTFPAAQILGQVVTGTLLGTVTDTSGAVIPNASVTLTNDGTGVSLRTTTSSQGYYTFATLIPGRYSVTVEVPGFKKEVSSANVVQVEQSTRVDLRLAPGQVNQVVTVNGATPLVQTATSDLGQTIDSYQVNNLPVNGRLFETLMQVAPGTTPAAWGDQIENPAASGSMASGGAGNGDMTSVNGFPFQANLYLVDGVTDVELENAYIAIAIPFAEISEMKMETSDPTAEYGTFGGMVVNMTTKSGTNSFHGQAFEYNRNTVFNAADRFTRVNPPVHMNQFGGELDGPIIRDKLFFSLDYQGLLQHQSSSGIWSVPTLAARAGDLSAFDVNGAGPINNATACALSAAANGLAGAMPCTASASDTVPGTYDTVPAADMVPIAAAWMSPSIEVAPSLPGPTNNYAYTQLTEETVNQFDVRGDYAMSDKNHLFARASYFRRDYTQPSPGTPYMNNGNANGNSVTSNDVLGWDYFFSSKMINQLRLGYSRYATEDFNAQFGISANNNLGVPNGNIASLPVTSGIAQLNFGSSSGPTFQGTGDPGWVPNELGRLSNIYQVNDQVNMIRGPHDFKFGVSYNRVQARVKNAQNDPRGQFYADGNYTGAGTTGASLADWLVGALSGTHRDIFFTTPNTRTNFIGLFAQDNYRVTNKLTLNLGLRYDIYTAPVDTNNFQSNFLTTGANAGLIQVASSSNRSPNVSTYYGNVGPRVGFAYAMNGGRTVAHAAYGISYFNDNFGAMGGTLERNFPFLEQENNSAVNSNCSTPYTGPQTYLYSGCGSLILANGLPGITPGTPGVTPGVVYEPLILPTTTPGGFIASPPGFGVYQIAQNFRQDMAQAWNVTVEQQLTPTLSFQMAYVGTAGSHLYHDYQLNQCNPTSYSVPETPPPYPACLPFYSIAPTISTMDFRNSAGKSHYNAGQLLVQKRASYGLTFTAAYTWSKMMDNINNPITSYSTKQELDTASWQRNNFPQVLTLTYIYELPFGRNKQFLNSGSAWQNALVGGWMISGITNFRSGPPLLVTASSGGLLPQNSGQRANWLCQGGGANNPQTISKWFDTGCFAQPQGFVLGNGGVGDVYGPRYQDWDVTGSKALLFGKDGSKQLKFEASFFNVFNHVNLGQPDTGVNDSNFGVVSSDFQPRYGQLGMVFAF